MRPSGSGVLGAALRCALNSGISNEQDEDDFIERERHVVWQVDNPRLAHGRIVASFAGAAVPVSSWLHQLTATTRPNGRLAGHGVRDGKAMIATLRHRLIRVPARLIRHAGQLVLRLPPGHGLLAEILTRLRTLPLPS